MKTKINKDSKLKKSLNKRINKDLQKSFDLMDWEEKLTFQQLTKLWF